VAIILVTAAPSKQSFKNSEYMPQPTVRRANPRGVPVIEALLGCCHGGP
jgi:hypothetical protein